MHPLDTARKFNIHSNYIKFNKRRPGRFLNVLCMLSLRNVLRGYTMTADKQNDLY